LRKVRNARLAQRQWADGMIARRLHVMSVPALQSGVVEGVGFLKPPLMSRAW
jgi:hypothetical protein